MIKLINYEIKEDEEYITGGTCELCFSYDYVDELLLFFEDEEGNGYVVSSVIEEEECYGSWECYTEIRDRFEGVGNIFKFIDYIKDNCDLITSLESLEQDVSFIYKEYLKNEV